MWAGPVSNSRLVINIAMRIHVSVEKMTEKPAHRNGIGVCMVIVPVTCDNISPFPIGFAACQKMCDLRA